MNEQENAEIELCMKFIKNCMMPSKKVLTKHSSYFYKHLCQYYFNTYISNDSFVFAAEKMGAISMPTKSGINRYFNLKLNAKKNLYHEYHTDFLPATERLKLINNKNL